MNLLHSAGIFLIVIGAYSLLHNELLMHNNSLTKDFKAIGFWCRIAATVLAIGITLVLL